MEPVTPSGKRGPQGRTPSGEHTEISSTVAPWQDTLDQGVDTPTRKHELGQLDAFDLPAGTPIGSDYRIERKLGQGGMGVVYTAVHPRIGARAAVKILKRELCHDPFQIERFIDEARIVNEIRHPNIVDVFDFGELADGRSYCLMELLEGESLYTRLQRTPRLSVDDVAAIVLPLASALAAAHDKGVIHRDLKPDNVFLVDVHDDLPRVKLLDFGIAKLARDDHRAEKTATGAMVGTPQYMAPEQAKGYAIDPRADIYALGGIVFEMLVGEPPFVADNPMEIVAKHLIEPPRHPNTLVRGVPIELDELVVAMLDKDARQRPSLATVCEVLERASQRRSQSFTAATNIAVALPPGAARGPTSPSEELAAPPRPVAPMPTAPELGALVSGTIDGPAPAPRPAALGPLSARAVSAPSSHAVSAPSSHAVSGSPSPPAVSGSPSPPAVSGSPSPPAVSGSPSARAVPAGLISGPDPVAPILPPVQHDKARSSSLRFYLLAALITMVAAIGTYLLVRTLAAKEPVDTPSAAVPDGAPAPAVTPLDAAPPVKPPEVKPPEVKPPEVKPPEVKPPEVKPPPKKPPPSSTTNATKPKPSLTTVKPKPPETGSAKARIEPKVDPYDRSHPNTGPISDPPPSKKDGTELLEPSGTKPAGR